MNVVIKRLLIKELNNIIDKINADTCEFTEEEAMSLLSVISHEALSKEQACEYLNMPRATFDYHVAKGDIPQGRKIKGRTGLVWYKDELSKK